MKSLILYSSTKWTAKHSWKKVYDGNGKQVYIRTQVIDADILEALSKAHPLEGETVLNTIELE